MTETSKWVNLSQLKALGRMNLRRGQWIENKEKNERCKDRKFNLLHHMYKAQGFFTLRRALDVD